MRIRLTQSGEIGDNAVVVSWKPWSPYDQLPRKALNVAIAVYWG